MDGSEGNLQRAMQAIKGVEMISEYKVSCPKCLLPTASIRREPNDLSTFLDCSNCGLKKEGRLPRTNEVIERKLFNFVLQRLERRKLLDALYGFALPSIVIVAVGLQYRDIKIEAILIGFLIILGATKFNNQRRIDHIMRVAGYSPLVSGDKREISTVMGEFSPSDLVHDYEIAVGAFDEAEVAKLDNRYLAFSLWLANNLRRMGCTDQAVEKEISKFYVALIEATKDAKEMDGKPLLGVYQEEATPRS